MSRAHINRENAKSTLRVKMLVRKKQKKNEKKKKKRFLGKRNRSLFMRKVTTNA